MCLETIIKAAISTNECLSKFPINLTILEIMSGNCIASKEFYTRLKHKHFICTDIIDYSSRNKQLPFAQLNTVDAVAMYGQTANVLLLISPPPCCGKLKTGFADYLAYLDFINGTNINQIKFIVVVGELGRSDGTEGTYRFLMRHPNLKLIQYELLSKKPDCIGGFVKKELHIFIISK